MSQIEFTEMEQIVGELLTPCDYAGLEGANPCPDQPAAWVLFLKPCCGVVRHRLACTHCKDVRLAGEGCVECPDCGHVTFPAREAYFLVEAL